MAAPVNYYWGDVLTTGNTTMQQSLSVLGQPYFVANIQSATDGTAIIGSAAVPFSNIYATQSNVGTANLTSPLSITIPFQISGNLLASNAIQTTNVTGTTMNAAQVVTSTAILGSVGTGGANFNLSGNAYTGSMKTTNVFASLSNVGRVNTSTLVTGTIGTTGAALGFSGNMWVSNALTTTNISATSGNVSQRANVVTSVTAGRVLVNDAGVSTFSSLGNAYFSNSVTTSNIFGAAPARVATANVGSFLTNLNATGVPMSNAWAYVPLGGASDAQATTDDFANLSFNAGNITLISSGGPGDAPHVRPQSNLSFVASTGLDLPDIVNGGPPTESFSVSFWFKLRGDPASITTQCTLLSLVSDVNDQFNIIISPDATFGFETYTATDGWGFTFVSYDPIQYNKWHSLSLWWTGYNFYPIYDGSVGGVDTVNITGTTRISTIIFGSRADGSQKISSQVGTYGYGLARLRIFKSLPPSFLSISDSAKLLQLDARSYYENRVLGNVAVSNAIMISDSANATVMRGSTMNTNSIARLSISFPRPWILINFDQGAQDTGTAGIVGPVYTYNGILPYPQSWRKNGPGGAPSMYLDGVTYPTVYLNWTLSRRARPLWTYFIEKSPWWNDFNGLTASIWVKFGGAMPGYGKAPALFTIGVKNLSSGTTGCVGVVIGDPNNYWIQPQLELLTMPDQYSYIVTPYYDPFTGQPPPNNSASPDMWHHIVLVFTADNQTIKFFVNNSLVIEIPNPFSYDSYYISDSMHIGRTPDNNSIFNSFGLTYIETSRLAVFDREFTTFEVRALYNLNAAPVENQVATTNSRAVVASNAITVPSLVTYNSLGATTMNVDSLQTVSFNMKLDPIISLDFDGRLTSSVTNSFITGGAPVGPSPTYKRTGGPGGGPSIYLPGYGDPTNGSPAYVTWPTSVIPVFNTGFSISIWFKLTPNTQNPDTIPNNYIISWGSDGSGAWGSATFFITFDNNTLTAGYISQGGYTGPLAWNRGEWNHVVVTLAPNYDGTFIQQIFVNGSQTGSTLFPYAKNIGGDALTIGYCQDNIELADFKVFQRPLSSTEITKLYGMKGLGNQTTVFGNLSASNALTATNVFAQNANLTTLNVSSVVSRVSVRPPSVAPKWRIPLDYSLAEVNGRLSVDTTNHVSGATFTEGSPIGGGVADMTYSQGYLTSDGTSGLYYDNGITLSCWVKFTYAPPQAILVDVNTNLIYCSLGVDFVGFYFGYDGLTTHFYSQSNGVNYNPPPTSNTWYHVVAQLGAYTGGDVYQTIWVNGIETTSPALRGINYPGAYAWYMQVGSSAGPMQMFDVRVYNSTLTSTEIKALYEWRASPHTVAIRGNIYVSNSLSTTSVTGLGVANVSGSLNVNSLTTIWPINQISGLIGQIDFAGSYNDVFGKLTYSSGSGTFSQNGPIGGPSATFSSTLFLTMPYYYAECWSGTSISLWFNSASYDFFSMNASYFYPGIRFFIAPGPPDTLFIYMFSDPNIGQQIIPTISMTMPDNGWHHICLNINPSFPGGADPSASLYFDGIFVQTTTGTGFSGALVNQFFQETMFFGNGNFTGFKLFSKTLSVAEIAAIASAGIANPSDLTVYGNISVANSFSPNTLLTSNMNATTLNTASWTLNTFSFPNIAVQNTLTTVGANVTTLNTGSLATGTLLAGGASTSNVTTGNAASTNNVLASGTITYQEDLTKRSIHLRPSQANAAAIQGWISATCNAAYQPAVSYWATNRTPIFANIVSGSGSGYSGSVLLPDGRVVTSSSAGPAIFNPANSTLSEIAGTGVLPGSFSGGVLLPNGNVIFCPQLSNAGLLNPVTGAYSNVANFTPGSYNGVLTANGVAFTPTGVPSNVINYNYSTGTFANVLAIRPPSTSGSLSSIFRLSSASGSSPSAAAHNAVAWSPQLGLFVSCLASGTQLEWSADGKNWYAATTPPVNSLGFGPWQGVTWSPQLGLFVAVCNGFAYSAYSSDGKNWTAGAFITFGANWQAVEWSPQLGLFAAVGTASAAYMAYSTDGRNWSQATTIVGTAWNHLAWAPQLGRFATVGGSPYFAYSNDGKNWTAGSFLSGTWLGVAWSPQLGLFVAVGSATPYQAWSSDGITWTGVSSPTAGTWTSVAWSPQLGLFLAVGSATPYALYSTDGKVWASATSLGTTPKRIAWSPELGIFACVLSASPYVTYTSSVTSGVPSFTAARNGSLLLPNGNVAFSPPGSSNLMQFDPVTLVSSNLSIGWDGYSGLVLTPNGNIVAAPSAANVISINPSAFTSSNIGPVTGGGSNISSWFQGGALLPYGNIIFTPGVSGNVGMFDPVALTYSNGTQVGANTTVKFSGSMLLPSGQVVMQPVLGKNVAVLDTTTPAPPEFCLSPYVNKF